MHADPENAKESLVVSLFLHFWDLRWQELLVKCMKIYNRTMATMIATTKSPPKIRGRFLPLDKWGPHDTQGSNKRSTFSPEQQQQQQKQQHQGERDLQKSNTVIPYWWMNTFIAKNRSELESEESQTSTVPNEFSSVDSSESFGVDTSLNEISLEEPNILEANETDNLTSKDYNIVTESDILHTSNSPGTNDDLSNVREEIQLTESILYQNNSNSIEVLDTDIDKEVQLINNEKESQLTEYFDSREESTKIYEEIKLTEAPVKTVSHVEQSTVINNEVIDKEESEQSTAETETNKEVVDMEESSFKYTNIGKNDDLIEGGSLTRNNNVNKDVITIRNDVMNNEEKDVITTNNNKKSYEMSNDDNGRTIPISRNVSIDVLHGQLIKMLDNLARKYNKTN